MLPKLVIATHGIRTSAKWQKTIGEILGDNHIRFRLHDYGYYGIHRFLRPSINEKMVDKFYETYQSIVREHSETVDLNNFAKRPSIIAHSFGTYLVGYSMLKYEDMRYDKIILCGSILPYDFDWWTLFVRDQVNFVRNEYGRKDIWAKTAKMIIPRTGDSGARGFKATRTNFLEQHCFDYFKHSDYFSRSHVDTHWMPCLKREPCNRTVRHGNGLSSQEFSNYLSITGQLDKVCYGNLAGYQDAEVELGTGLDWITINPDIYTFLVDPTTADFGGKLPGVPEISCH